MTTFPAFLEHKSFADYRAACIPSFDECKSVDIAYREMSGANPMSLYSQWAEHWELSKTDSDFAAIAKAYEK